MWRNHYLKWHLNVSNKHKNKKDVIVTMIIMILMKLFKCVRSMEFHLKYRALLKSCELMVCEVVFNSWGTT